MTRALVLRLALILFAFAVAGVLAGLVWHALWTPPTGVVYQDQWRIDSEGAPADVNGTGLYVVVSAATGIVMGFGTALVTRGHEVATLVAVSVGSALAGALMAITGHQLGPPDPRPLAAGQPDFTEIEADLRVEGWSPYVGFPTGALAALGVTFLALNGAARNRLDEEPDG